MKARERTVPATRSLNLFDEDRLRLTQAESLRELRDDLLRASYQPGEVRLDSGVGQPYFFDKYLMFARPAILRRLGRFLGQSVPHGTDRIAAPTLGAVPLGTAVSLETGLPLAIVRTSWDGSRRGNPVEGGLHRGEAVALIEDVVVTGSRAARAVDRVHQAGANVVMVLAVIDCERGATERLSGLGVDFTALFRYSAFPQVKRNQ